MKITDFDPAEYLTTKETIVEYLNEALKTSVEDNASEHIIEALGDVTRAQGITNAAKATKLINNPDASVGVCCSHKVVAVGFNTLCSDASVGVLNPPHE